MTPQAYCKQKVKNSGSSFYYSFLFLSPVQRRAMIALYAFCREIDDIVDSPKTKHADNKLQWWKNEITQSFSHTAKHPIAIEISHSLKNYNFKLKYFLDIIDGMQMDLQHQGFNSLEELNNYCYHVAGAVGLLTIEITGYHVENTHKMQSYAKKLANALQLINIIRDIKEDLSIGRIYLPQQLLLKFNINSSQLSNHASPQLLQLLTYLADHAESLYQQAVYDLPKEERYQQRSGLIMADIYLAILKKIKQLNYPVLQQKVKISPLKKLWVAWTTMRNETALHKQLSKTY